MATQLQLFPGEKAYGAVWTLENVGVQAAAELVVQLIRDDVVPVTEFAIAKRRLQLDQNIPQEMAATFTGLVEQIHDERYRIKARVEEISEYRLVVIDHFGRAARGNGRTTAAGFDLRASVAGVQDDAAQIRMSVGSIAAALSRHKELCDSENAITQLMQIIEPVQRQLGLPDAK